ncbi:MAG: hypothetical protein WCI49_09780 [Ferruginibacter sp.]
MSTGLKLLILASCIICSLYGFLIKIPVPLRGHDKLLHAGFYFGAAVFLNFLFQKKQVLIFILLALFGVLIEYLQQVSNKIMHSHIHGRFDKEDIYANMKGLFLYAGIALIYFAFAAILRTEKKESSNI